MYNEEQRPNLEAIWHESGDVRVLWDIITTYTYTSDEVNELIETYAPYPLNDNYALPTLEHIYTVMYHYPKCKISSETLEQIKRQYDSEYYDEIYNHFSKRNSILPNVCYDYTFMKHHFLKSYGKELIEILWHPKNMWKWKGWGFDDCEELEEFDD